VLLRPLCCCALSAPAPSLLWHAVLTACLQGSLIALVDDRDMARLIASHNSMQWLLLSEAQALVPTSGKEKHNGQGALVPTAGKELLDGEGPLVPTAGKEMIDGEGSLDSTSDTEMPDDEGALVSTSDTEMQDGQNALPLPVAATASPCALLEGQHLAPAVQAAPSSSLVLPDGCFVVTCKNSSMYGKKMRDVHIAGFSMKSDAIARFRRMDGKVVVADILVGVGRYACVKLAQKAIYKMMEESDGKLSDLDSIEVDKELFDQKVCTFLNYF